MVLVAVVGLILGGRIALQKRRDAFLKTAHHYSVEWGGVEHDLLSLQRRTTGLPFTSEQNRWRHHQQDLLDYHRMMTDKYRYAADHPWFPVANDPAIPILIR